MHTTLHTLWMTVLLIGTACAVATPQASYQQSETTENSASGASYDPYGDSSGRVVEAEQRLAELRKIFNPNDSFDNIVRRLNDHDPENSDSQYLNEVDIQKFISSSNGISNVYVVADGKWEVTGTGKERGTDALRTWVDANGQSIVQQMINALRASKSGSARISYPVLIASPTGGQPIREKEIAVVVSSTYLMGQENNTGKKFLAFIKVH